MRHALTKEQRRELRLLYQSGGYSYRDLASKYHISLSTVSKVLNDYERSDIAKFKGYCRKPKRNRLPMSRKFDRRVVVKSLIDAVSEFSLMDNWKEIYLMEILLSCGLTRDDFEEAGYVKFYDEYFSGE